MAEKRIYRVIFHNRGEVYEVYASSVSQGSLFGFVEVETILFGERSQIVVDPSEDKLKHEFKDVDRFYVPMHSIVRIDEVEKEGPNKILSTGDEKSGKVTPFPLPITPPPGRSD